MLTINKKKTKNIIIRIPEDERDDLRRVVEAKGISLSDYIRALINEDLNNWNMQRRWYYEVYSYRV